MRRSRESVLLPALTATTGVVVAHIVGYAAAFPDAAERAHHLGATGHGYWPLAVLFALVAGSGGVVLHVVRGARRGLAGPQPASLPAPFHARAGRLVAWQLGAFIAMEVTERLAVADGPTSVLHSRAFVLGLGAQLVVAVVALVLVNLVERLACRVASAFVRPAAPPPKVLLHWQWSETPFSAAPRSRARPRAPPEVALI